MLDLAPATRTLADLVTAVRVDQLDAPTPCPGTSVAAMLDHVAGFTLAFTAAANHTEPPGGSRPPSVDASRLAEDWPTLIPARLTELADAWREQAAWSGMTKAGGVDLPSPVAGVIALDEVVIHGWDLAVATGQPYVVEPQLLDAVYEFVRGSAEQNPEGTPGLFGPPIFQPDDAPLLDRVVGLAGRNPDWTPTSTGQ
jgi:uncharacterized protein (TIGR03086 family)